MLPWTDRAGRFSPLKAVVLAGLLLPGLLLAVAFARAMMAAPGTAGPLGPRPFEEAIHQSGSWAIRFLVLSLAVTPLRRIADWPKLIQVRRMIGVAAFAYALAHFALYVADMNFDLGRVASEIVLRIYLTIGFTALLILSALAATSTDAAIRRLGPNWTRLHRLTYVAGVLAALHFFMQTKADVYEATFVTGLFVTLIFYRLAHRRGLRLTSPLVLAGIALAAALATAGLEYVWYALATGVPPARVLAANLQFSYQIRPAWWVLAAGLAMAGVAAARPLLPGPGKAGRGRPARAAA